MRKQVEATILRRSLARPGDRLGVAVSGGADSVALLHVLRDLGFELTILHVNHGLRGAESEGDEAFVRALASELGLPVLVHRPELHAGNLEEAAREARYAWFRELVRERRVDRVAVGHTQSDQAETVLFRFLRGSGTAGLAAIRPITADRIVRPLLDVSREEVRDYLASHGLAWREDSSNAVLDFARNRIRRDLLPALERDWNPRLTATLAQTADLALAEEDYWADEVRRLAADWVRFAKSAAVVPASRLARLPAAAARRLVRHVIEQIKGDLRQIEFGHVEEIRALAASAMGHGAVTIPGLFVNRSFDWVRFAKSPAAPAAFRVPLRVPGAMELPGTDVCLQAELKAADCVYNNGGYQLDWGLVSGSLEVRNWRPGDHYKRAGHSSEDKLKHLFHRARVPLWERNRWPVIARGNAIVWVRGFGPGADFVRTQATRTVLLIREQAIQDPEWANQNV